MSVSGSSASRKSICATIRFADASLTSVPRKTIRSRRSLEKMSNERSKRPSDSTTIGTRWLNALLIGCTFIRNRTVARQGGTVMEVEREITIEAPPEEVWEALVEPERLEEWFANDVELDPVPGGEGTFRWEDGEERRAVVREIDEARRLVLDWDDGRQVVIELEAVEAGTVVHVPETAPDFATSLELRAFAWTLAA